MFNEINKHRKDILSKVSHACLAVTNNQTSN